jgi:hypothetical protein
LIIAIALTGYESLGLSWILTPSSARPGSLTRPVGLPAASFSIQGWFIVASPIASMPFWFRNAQQRENCR